MDKKVLILLLCLVVLVLTMMVVHRYIESEDEAPAKKETVKEGTEESSDVMKLFKKNLE